MKLQDCEYLIQRILRKVPEYLKDDCYQAAWIGLLKAQEKASGGSIEYFKSYAYRCMQSEVTQEIAKLHGDGRGMFSMEKTAFLEFCEYKRVVDRGDDPEEMGLSEERLKIFEDFAGSHRVSYVENPSREELYD